MSRLILWEDDIKKIKWLKVGDSFSLMKSFNFSGKNGYCAKSHLDRVRPIGKKYWVAEDVLFFQPEGDSNRLRSGSQEGYAADASELLLKGWYSCGKSYRPSNMPKAYSRFEVEVLSHGKIFNDSTSWFSASIDYKIVSKVE